MADGGSADDQWLVGPGRPRAGDGQEPGEPAGLCHSADLFRERGRFPRDEGEVETQGIAALSKQLDVPAPIDGEAFLTGRTAERLRAEIRVRFGFREATVADADLLTVWLRDHIAGEVGGDIEPMIERLKRAAANSPSSRRRPTAWSGSRAARCAPTKTSSTTASMSGCRPQRARVWMPYCVLRQQATRIQVRTRQRQCAGGAAETAWQSRSAQPGQHAGRTGEAGTDPGH